jgi:hypothetical protein
MRDLRWLPLAAVPLLAACAGTPRLSAMHDPLYRAQNHTSTITARATETRDGIAEIRIEATIGELTTCGGSIFALPSLIPCRTGAVNFVIVCNFANVKSEVTCAVPFAITPRRMITYTVTARSAAGRTASWNAVTYAAGAPVTQASIFGIPVPFETARPVIWRTGAPASGANRSGTIDVGFVPNDDYANYRQFTDDLQPLALEVFHNGTTQTTQFTRTVRNIFNLWAGPTGASAGRPNDDAPCFRNINAPASTVRAAFDGTTIMHRNAFRDCANISMGGGSGTIQTTLSDAGYVFVHEAGHFLFGLGDEYVGGGNSSVSSPRNVLNSQSACQTESSANSLPTGQCVQIGTTGRWRNDDGQLSIMEDRSNDSDWRTLSSRAVGNMLSACASGNCY